MILAWNRRELKARASRGSIRKRVETVPPLRTRRAVTQHAPFTPIATNTCITPWVSKFPSTGSHFTWNDNPPRHNDPMFRGENFVEISARYGDADEPPSGSSLDMKTRYVCQPRDTRNFQADFSFTFHSWALPAFFFTSVWRKVGRRKVLMCEILFGDLPSRGELFFTTLVRCKRLIQIK